MTLLIKITVVLLCFMLAQCSGGSNTKPSNTNPPANTSESDTPTPTRPEEFYLGADLSYVNEMEDCGAVYRVNSVAQDPYELFAEQGSNIVRVRLWHNPDWTAYSNLSDVTETIKRAQASGQNVLLDFHYSDTWADPEKQYIPAAWQNLIDDDEALADALYDYTQSVLETLLNEDAVPEFVQVGNETNSEILQLESEMDTDTINWQRNALLLNHGLQAVADFNQTHEQSVQRFLHIAQPENALWWFSQASAAGILDYEFIGISYYPKWSTYSLDALPQAIESLTTSYDKKVVVVETAYPWSLGNADAATNVLGEDSLIPGFAATASGQKAFMEALVEAVIIGGGSGVIYWEPAWVSTSCSTLWGTGSHWENAAFFDGATNALPVMSIFSFAK